MTALLIAQSWAALRNQKRKKTCCNVATSFGLYRLVRLLGVKEAIDGADLRQQLLLQLQQQLTG